MVKEYHQYCPMSYSLDVIGDRWTLHIIRDLMFGALRFSDIQSGLSIASNLLTKRLKDLEAADVIEQVQLPPPANVKVYQLTARGRELQPVLIALANWGVPYLQATPPAEDQVGISQVRSYLLKYFAAENAQGVSLICQFQTDAHHLYVTIDRGRATTTLGQAPDADCIVQLDELRTLVALCNRALSLDAALDSGQIVFQDGDSEMLAQFIACFTAVSV